MKLKTPTHIIQALYLMFFSLTFFSHSFGQIALKNDPSELLDMYFHKTEMFYAENVFDSVIYYGEKYVKTFEQKTDSSKLDQYTSLLSYCFFSNQRSHNLKMALEYGKKSIDINLKYKLKDSTGLLNEFLVFASLRYRSKEYKEALDISNSVLNFLDNSKIKNDTLIDFNKALNLSLVGSIYSKMNDTKNAKIYFEKLLELPAYKYKNIPLIYFILISMRDNYGIFLLENGENEKALNIFLESEKLINTIDIKQVDPIIPFLIYANLAKTYEEREDYPAAEKYFYLTEHFGNSNPYFQTSPQFLEFLSNSVSFYDELGRIDKVMEIKGKLTNLYYSDSTDASNLDRANYFLNLAMDALPYKEQLYRSEDYLLKALELISASESGKASELYPSILRGLGKVHIKAGEIKEGEDLFNEAYKINLTNFGFENYRTGNILHDLAKLNADNGNFKKADSIEMVAIDLTKKIDLLCGSLDFNYNVSSIELFCKTGNKTKALELLKSVLQSNKNKINTYFSQMTEKEKSEFSEELNWSFFIIMGIYISKSEEDAQWIKLLYGYWIVIKGSVLFDEKAYKYSGVEVRDSVLASKYSKLKFKKQALSNMKFDYMQNNRSNTDSLNSQINRLEKEISITKTKTPKKELYQNLSLDSISSRIAADQAIVELCHFHYYNKEWTDTTIYVAFILTKETKKNPLMLIFKNGNDLDKIYFNHYQQYLTNPQQREDKDWESYQHYWAAIDSAIGDKKIVYVSPDGIYNKINLQTLVTPDGKYLSDTKDIRIIGSSRDLLLPLSKNKKAVKDAMLVGNPNFKTNNAIVDTSRLVDNQHNSDALLYTTRSFDKTDLSQLPAAEKEVKAISTLLKKKKYQTVTLTGNDAQEARIKAVSSPSILHIATHGFFEKDLKVDNDGNFKKAIENPMLRSGLLLAGAENTIKGNYKPTEGTENGILTAYEVQQMNLDSTELVVLSACETGLGDVKNGEGVYGLQRAFRIAGAKTIIMSLWKVDDEATQQLMTTFYDNWLSGKTKREAFNTAQGILKKSLRYSHPYYWGAFVLIGE